jgi:hypothetical protein
MATKDDIRANILKVEPENAVALDPAAPHKALADEMKNVKKRQDDKTKKDSINVGVLYRMEDDNKMSWKFVDDEGEPVVNRLFFGAQLPIVGNIISVSDTLNVVVKSAPKAGLTICAGDLEFREAFDCRRIYLTGNGTKVVFKRTENDRTVLWSYRVQSEVMINRKVQLDRTEDLASAAAVIKKKMTQKVLAAFLISRDPNIAPNQLTAELQNAFPQALISSRHGPHYLSLSRNGKLPEPSEDDPRTW